MPKPLRVIQRHVIASEAKHFRRRTSSSSRKVLAQKRAVQSRDCFVPSLEGTVKGFLLSAGAGAPAFVAALLAMTTFILFISIFSSSAYAFEESAEVKRAIDGESLELIDGRIVRMIGVAANNVRPILTTRFRATPDQIASMPLARLNEEIAKHIEKNIIGRNVMLSYDPTNERTSHLDPEGRILAYVWYSIHYKAREGSVEYENKPMGIQTEDRLLNSEIIRLGLAFVDTRMNFLQQDLFLRYERDAAKNKDGVWKSWAEIYDEILSKARSSRTGSLSDFVPEDVRELSLQSSRRAFNELISANPNDWRPYYERSWLGASPLLDRVKTSNLMDVEQAISLTKINPIPQLHRHYLLRLLDRHEEALAAYTAATQLAAKLGMPTELTEQTASDLEKGFFDSFGTEKPTKDSSLAQEAVRAIYNEDHFLIFMAHVKSPGDFSPELLRSLHQYIQSRGRFPDYAEKYKEIIERGAARELLYNTQWALRGLETPEEVLRWMETFGSAEGALEDKTKDESGAKARGPRPGSSLAAPQAVPAQRA